MDFHVTLSSAISCLFLEIFKGLRITLRILYFLQINLYIYIFNTKINKELIQKK